MARIEDVRVAAYTVPTDRPASDETLAQLGDDAHP